VNRSLYPLAWCYVAAFALAMFACHTVGVADPTRITTTPAVVSP
jgi:hypothetical protein